MLIEVPNILRRMLVQEDAAVYTIPMSQWRKRADLTQLPNAGDFTNLGLVVANYSTASTHLIGSVPNDDTQTEYARNDNIILPIEYVDGQTVTLRFHVRGNDAGGISVATIDVRCFKSDKEQGVSADLCTTAAQDINVVAAWMDEDFTINPAGLVTGDKLDVEVSLSYNTDNVNLGEALIIGDAALLLDVKG